MQLRRIASVTASLAVLTGTAMAIQSATAATTPTTNPRNGQVTCVRGEVCVQSVTGVIPDSDHMVSTVIRYPKDGDILEKDTPFTVHTKSVNLATGAADGDPDVPDTISLQTLDNNGIVQGHSHVSIQRIEDPNQPPNPLTVLFFKELADPADGSGELTTLVDKGLPPGNYRACTMVGSFGHQPVLMPVVRRGAQDDCTRFSVK
ncbi:hypothetical protein [Streptomyces melanogenes]|uniref:hypothetical protein n=1 Tax=Streptomyces melanogenes TaxID=67326 RepID=UPI00167CEFC3|nr:hypothetical protein [Streptomyces melanogenes]GGP92516.1 hypothetical protein GCM10010278_83270 [Streptomyces melanogenes]